MLCVTGNERTTEALAARLTRVADHPQRHAWLQEVRIDALEGPFEPLFGLLERHRHSLVVCNRPPRQGGRFAGSETERLQLLRRAAATGVAYVDLEADCSAAQMASLRQALTGRLVLSWHDFEGIPDDVSRRLIQMSERGPDLLKLAVGLEDATQLDPLRDLQHRVDQPTLVLGMGLAGLLSRCRYPAFGAPWTYVKADEQSETAPGQISLDQALEMGLPRSADAPFVALVGGPQVEHSQGPRVYNRLFRRWGKPWSYLPICTAKAKPALQMLREMGLFGASVTMPHKAAALALAGDAADDLARWAGSANSLRFGEAGIEATNSDVAGVAEPLRRALGSVGTQACKQVLVLGAGGAARAAVLACQQLGLAVTVAARKDVRHFFAENVACVAWDDRTRVPADVLINATPVSGDRQIPWPAGTSLKKRIVFDLAISGQPSLLLQAAAAEGARTIEAIEMWLAQGAAQMSWIAGQRCSVEQLRELSR